MRFSLKKKITIPTKALGVILFVSLFFSFLYFVENHVKATLFEIAEIKVKNFATQIINDTIKNNLIAEYNPENLMQVKLDAQGRVAFVQPNTIEFNKLSADLVSKLQESLTGLSEARVDIPMGQLTGNILLAGLGPNITVKVLPMGTVDVELVNHFVDAGINQTKHSIGLMVKAKMKIVLPLMSKAIEVNTAVPIAEYIIVGSVPDTYAKFPIQQNSE